MNKKILVTPLNWGIGHATRCIPIINALIRYSFEPIIASDGNALELLKKEFSELQFIELPSYNISYSKSRINFKLKLLKDSPKVLKAIKSEKKLVGSIVEKYDIKGIISDNRFGVYSKNIPSVFMTHQLNVLSGNTTWFSSKLHQSIIKKFDECWIPDQRDSPNLSGKLGHLDSFKTKLKYIGPISRFNFLDLPKKNDLLVLLSGPEPQRSLLEELLFNQLKNYNKKVVFVRGVIEQKQTKITRNNLTIFNFMTSMELEHVLNKSKLVLARSGYTTIMDLAKLNKKAFFIPTPGQFEQEYLAKNLDSQNIVPYCEQKDFRLEMIEQVVDFTGLKTFDFRVDYKKLFSLFESK